MHKKCLDPQNINYPLILINHRLKLHKPLLEEIKLLWKKMFKNVLIKFQQVVAVDSKMKKKNLLYILIKKEKVSEFHENVTIKHIFRNTNTIISLNYMIKYLVLFMIMYKKNSEKQASNLAYILNIMMKKLCYYLGVYAT